jgi:hypothetical protein
MPGSTPNVSPLNELGPYLSRMTWPAFLGENRGRPYLPLGSDMSLIELTTPWSSSDRIWTWENVRSFQVDWTTEVPSRLYEGQNSKSAWLVAAVTAPSGIALDYATNN